MMLATWTPEQVIAVTAAVSASIGGLLTFLSTKGVDAYLKVKADARKDVEAEEKHMDDANTRLIAKLEGQVESILKELKEVRSEHQECVKNTGILTGKLEVLQVRDEEKSREIAALREEVNRLTRHERANLEHVEKLKRAELEAMGDAPRQV